MLPAKVILFIVRCVAHVWAKYHHTAIILIIAAQNNWFMRLFFLLLLIIPLLSNSQTRSYEDSLTNFQQQYVKDHEVVKAENKKQITFFPVNRDYRITAAFERKENSPWFLMNTSGAEKKQYRIYGTISFYVHDTAVQLQVYQSKALLGSAKYSEYLFIPFTDKTSGIETYGGGRYLDLLVTDLQNNRYLVDFNKAYNPYCAYTTGYNCPIPPRENDLPIAITAGEKNFGKH